MPGTPTAIHAYTLFCLTVEGQHGRNWRAAVTPKAVSALAEEIAAGFGGEAQGGQRKTDQDHAMTWRFPDGSLAETGAFGLRKAGEGQTRAA